MTMTNTPDTTTDTFADAEVAGIRDRVARTAAVAAQALRDLGALDDDDNGHLRPATRVAIARDILDDLRRMLA